MNDKKLNLKWVSDVIGNDYREWNNGDIITIQAQTGTGKTFFITGNKNKEGLIDKIESKSLLYLCNRVELKRQVKLDLLKKFDEIESILADKDSKEIKEINYNSRKIIIDYNKLDKIKEIKNVTVISYHKIANKELDKIYYDKDFTLNDFDYIVCDECHFSLIDPDFNNKTDLVFFKTIRAYYPNSIRIFISATMDEVYRPIKAAYENIKEHIDSNIKFYEYSTNTDYSYINAKYFKDIKDITNLIKNNKTDEKWLIFVTSKDEGKQLKELLNNNNITSEFIHANSISEEKKNISSKGEFTCKVLITTKCLDNGVNIIDREVKNVIINAFDKTTFIQELGRIRIDIENAREINLFIPTLKINNFQGKIRLYEKKKDQVKLFETDRNRFRRIYDRDHDKIYKDLIYLENGEYKYNNLGNSKLRSDINFAYKMQALFKGGIEMEDGTFEYDYGCKDKFAFIKEQLKWLGLEKTFNEDNLITDVVSNETKDGLKTFLEDAYNNNEIFSKDIFLDNFNKILESDSILMKIFNELDAGKIRVKGMKKINELLIKLGYDYIVYSKKETINSKRANYWRIGQTKE